MYVFLLFLDISGLSFSYGGKIELPQCTEDMPASLLNDFCSLNWHISSLKFHLIFLSDTRLYFLLSGQIKVLLYAGINSFESVSLCTTVLEVEAILSPEETFWLGATATLIFITGRSAILPCVLE